MDSLEELLKKEVRDINMSIEKSMDALKKQKDQGLKGNTTMAGNGSASVDELQKKRGYFRKEIR